MEYGQQPKLWNNANDLDRSRGDMPEVCVWSDTIGVWEQEAVIYTSSPSRKRCDSRKTLMQSERRWEAVIKTKALD